MAEQPPERDGAAIIKEYVEHDLDEHYDESVGVVFPIPPDGLIERVDAELARVRRETWAYAIRIAKSSAEMLDTLNCEAAEPMQALVIALERKRSET